MQALGVDLTDTGARAVVVNADGKVVRSEDAAWDSAAADARAIVQKLWSGEITAHGIAADTPEAAAAIQTEITGSTTHVVTPGAAAVAAETWIGAAQGAQHAVCLHIGERVFAGIYLAGRPWAGAHGLAGSAAWLALNPVERQDYRKFGSLAAEVSSKGIARRLAWRIQAGDQSDVLTRAGDLDSITAAHVYDGARAGDGVAISVVRDTAKYIGMAVANLATTLDPEVVVLGGPLACAHDLLLEPIRIEAVKRLPAAMLDQFRCEMSPLGADGVAIGAARLAMLSHP